MKDFKFLDDGGSPLPGDEVLNPFIEVSDKCRNLMNSFLEENCKDVSDLELKLMAEFVRDFADSTIYHYILFRRTPPIKPEVKKRGRPKKAK